KKYVDENSNGRIVVEENIGDTLGSANDALAGISIGTVEMSTFDIGIYGIYNRNTMVFMLPGKFRSREEAEAVFNSKWAFDNIHADLEKNNNIKIFGGVSKGFRCFTTKGYPLRRPEDIKGLTIRVMDSAMYVRMIQALSANPVPMAGSEMYNAMRNRVVDGHENAALSIWGDRTYEVQDNLIINRHVAAMQVWNISASFYNRLPADLQKVVVDGNAYASNESLKVVIDLNSRVLDNLRKAGMTIYEPTPEELQAWDAAYSGPCEAYLRTQIDPKIIDGFNATIEEYRAQK
ncbi:MAG: TRAP transporter substrate-binding protein, partial [Planctomycetes bacterium]|nr:TRAP transporter substrate-binding protein [Planctomycetota bacterium]